MKYRAEIDGLRAFAVVPVVFFHAGVELFSGGFIGVDVFFVISGYLITSILISDLQQGRFSLLRFYERRARRILPALIVMICACIPFALAWMSPLQLLSFGKAAASVALFASNILFWRESGYFDVSSEQNPLLHTWSLAVEEQYYILFPVLLAFAWRMGASRVFWIIAVGAVVSLLLTEYGWRYRTWANFYLLPTRAWELLAGSLCSFWLAYGRVKENGLLAGLGLSAIFVSFILFDSGTPFPSLYALLPVGGAVLVVLFARSRSLAGRLLASGPLVGIGLISYSLYLWHQPLLAFARLRSIDEPAQWLMLALAFLAFPMGWLSWRFVERPFRVRQEFDDETRGRFLVISASSLVVLLLVGGTIVSLKGLPGRFDPDIEQIDLAREDRNPISRDCRYFVNAAGAMRIPELPNRECIHQADKPVDVLVLGDSHADAIAYDVMEQLGEFGLNTFEVTTTACPSVLGIRRQRADCETASEHIHEYVEKSGASVIVFSLRYGLYADDQPFNNGEGGQERFDVDPILFTEQAVAADAFATKSGRVLGTIRKGIEKFLAMGKTVAVVYPIPEAGWTVPDRYLKQRIYRSGPQMLSVSEEVYLERNQEAIAMLDALDHPNLLRVNLRDVFCREVPGRCLNAIGGKVFYYDDDHLSRDGAKLVASAISDVLRPKLGNILESRITPVETALRGN
ncbi:acyltransferase family protein [Roseibium polysiphoniae]|uniref:Acyltransferase n=1 Tax=Roseibium polysiphoniae TaxID=2571221 RepID=A0ABR9C7P8_9HYPH|nr:acyltransferase family protein [Roseibium polysiphoniae]MBD8875623.1 acyltransferase [Roseibium polysiphoniae]